MMHENIIVCLIDNFIKNRSKEFRKTGVIQAVPWSSNNFTVNSKDLHVFIPDDSNIALSIKQFIDMFSKRTNGNTEYWLFDESFWDYPLLIKELLLDLDDDLYVYKGNENAVTIWEYYEVHKTKPRKFQFYCSWNKVNGLGCNKDNKWIRRKNLEGVKFAFKEIPVSSNRDFSFSSQM